MQRVKIDPMSNGIVHKKGTYMVAGYLSDYKLTYDEDVLSQVDGSKEKELTVNDFIENKGYVDDKGYIHIFRTNPNRAEEIPWFTVVMDENGKPRLKFTQYRNPRIKEAFHVSRMGDLSLQPMAKRIAEGELNYTESVLEEIANASSTYVPKIQHEDDFLKKLIKTTILEKGVDVHKYRIKFSNAYQLSNLKQALDNKTKVSPLAFIQWMDLEDLDFKVIITDNGKDKENPLKYPVEYDSKKNQIIIRGKKTREGEEEPKMARSARQFS